MADWDTDSTQMRLNLSKVMAAARDAMRARVLPDLTMMRRFHAGAMEGLTTNYPELIGVYRGEPGAEWAHVTIGVFEGTPPQNVLTELAVFESRLQAAIAALDGAIPSGETPNKDQLAAVLDVSAWVHSEWVRIHPFGNGNGRTARLWVNMIAERYNLPSYMALRPRPDGDYVALATAAMTGQWQRFVPLLRAQLDAALADLTS